MTNEEIIEKIRTTLAEEFEVDIDVIQPDAPLMETLELDSLDLVDMVVLVEKNFGFNVTGQDFAGIKTFQDFCNLVITRMLETQYTYRHGKSKPGVERSDTYSLFI